MKSIAQTDRILFESEACLVIAQVLLNTGAIAVHVMRSCLLSTESEYYLEHVKKFVQGEPLLRWVEPFVEGDYWMMGRKDPEHLLYVPKEV